MFPDEEGEPFVFCGQSGNVLSYGKMVSHLFIVSGTLVCDLNSVKRPRADFLIVGIPFVVIAATPAIPTSREQWQGMKAHIIRIERIILPPAIQSFFLVFVGGDVFADLDKASLRMIDQVALLVAQGDDRFGFGIETFLFTKGVVEQRGGKLVPIWRKSLTRLSPLEIVDTYNAELRGICNYYCMASNYASLNYFSYLMEYSCLKTLSAKARRSLRKTLAAYKDGHGKWGIPYETKTGKKRMYFANWQKCRKEASACNDTINDVFMMHNHNRNSLEARLKARVCELCGTTQGELFELHHVRKVKDLNGKERWEQCMIAKRRKTLVVCKPCHNAIHHGSKSQ